MTYLQAMVRGTDLNRSPGFYCDLLGLREGRRQVHDKDRFTPVFLATPAESHVAAR